MSQKVCFYLLLASTLLLSVKALPHGDDDDDGSSHEDNYGNNEDGGKEHGNHLGLLIFHYLTTVILEVLILQLSAPFALCRRRKIAIPMQIVVTIYMVLDFIFLRYPDSNNIEERASRFTGFLLMILAPTMVVLGLLSNVPGAGTTYSGIGSNLHVNKGKLRVIEHSYFFLAIVVPLIAYVRVGMAIVSMLGFCRGSHLGQCLAHGIMGSSFILYGGYLLMMLVAGQELLKRAGHSQEFYDSIAITAWGIVNTFTEHRWGQEWNHGDYQHTAMGIIWWAAGLFGIFLSRNNRRNWVPAAVLIFTGYAMSQHAQHLEISTKVHFVFGLALMAAGAFRIIEISFLLDDKGQAPDNKVRSFQYLPPFCLVESGMMFQSANEEQLMLLHGANIDHSSYVLVITSFAFLIFLWFSTLITIYLKLKDHYVTGVSASTQDEYSHEENNGFRGIEDEGFEIESVAQPLSHGGSFEMDSLREDVTFAESAYNSPDRVLLNNGDSQFSDYAINK